MGCCGSVFLREDSQRAGGLTPIIRAKAFNDALNGFFQDWSLRSGTLMLWYISAALPVRDKSRGETARSR